MGQNLEMCQPKITIVCIYSVLEIIQYNTAQYNTVAGETLYSGRAGKR